MTAMQWFFSFLKKYRKNLIIALILLTFTSILTIINPYVSGIIVDDVIKGGNKELLLKLVLLLVATTLVRSVIRYIYLYMFETTSQKLLYSMRDYVYRRFLEEDFAFYNKNRTGDLMSRQTGDMDAIRHFVSFVIYSIYENTLLFLIALIMIFTVDFRLALCMITILPLTAFMTYKQLRAVKPAFHNIRKHFSSLNTAVQENVSGNRVVKAFAKEDFEIEKFNKENDEYRNAELGAAAIWRKYVPVFEFLSNSLTFILYLVGGIMVVNGTITLGKLVTVSGYLWMLNNPLRMAGWLANDYQRFVTSVEKIYSTIKEDPAIKTPCNAVSSRKRFKGEIEFKNVNYRAEDDVILTDINFNIQPGQTVGIIGATGSGKSTLMNLLCRFFDVTDGTITIDGINVKDMDLYSLRGNIGMAMQDVFLFSDTIEGNIAYGNPNCTFEEVQEAAKIANADEFIKNMPDGYDTIVGERGMGLSGGQKQRISLARALLKNPSIVILDDTTSAVDMETEAHIQNQLNALTNRTVFIIAHRISSIKDADVILVVDNGKVLESGNHDSLIEKKGYYYTVFNHQYGEFDKYIKTKHKGGRHNG